MTKLTPDLTLTLSLAVSAYKAGQLVEAEQLCQQIIGTEPDLFDALHLLAVVQSKLGKKELALTSYELALKVQPNYPEALNNFGLALHELMRLEAALTNYQRALKIRPNYVEALFNQSVTLHELKRFKEALASYDCALTLRPDYAEAHNNRGLVLHELKRFEDALTSYSRALKARPNYADALFNRGMTLQELKRLEEALESYDRALKVRPDYAKALNNRGITLYELKRFDEALASYDRALKFRPNYAQPLSNRGNTLHELKRFEEALASYDRALKVRPDYAEALNNRGLTLHVLNRFEEALASYDRALTVQPDYAEAFSNRATTLHELRRFGEALSSYDRALTLRPNNAEAFTNRGATLHALGRFDEALASYDRALRLRPDYAEAHFNAALCWLLIGDFSRGWQQYEWRSQTEQRRDKKRNFVGPRWVGSGQIAGRTILLHAEQGFGDTIHFCRYVPLVADRSGRVVLEVQKPLHDLMSTLRGTAQIIASGDPPPEYDFHCPLLSLPLAFGTQLASIPSTTPYLRAPSHALRRWEKRLGTSDRLRIAICWHGNSNFKGDLSRSIGLAPLLPLLVNEDIEFFSLQKDLRAGDAEILRNNQHIIQLGDEIETFSDTAAIISSMDLILSSDTSVVHLAGALGKPIWILLQSVPDWRWLLDRDDSPWYPTARLFRQRDIGLWDDVVSRARDALAEFVQCHGRISAVSTVNNKWIDLTH